jgi:hypothetical protein
MRHVAYTLTWPTVVVFWCCYRYEPCFRQVRKPKFTKKIILLASTCLSVVCTYVTTPERLNGFSINLILWNFTKCGRFIWRPYARGGVCVGQSVWNMKHGYMKRLSPTYKGPFTRLKKYRIFLFQNWFRRASVGESLNRWLSFFAEVCEKNPISSAPFNERVLRRRIFARLCTRALCPAKKLVQIRTNTTSIISRKLNFLLLLNTWMHLSSYWFNHISFHYERNRVQTRFCFVAVWLRTKRREVLCLVSTDYGWKLTRWHAGTCTTEIKGVV